MTNKWYSDNDAGRKSKRWDDLMDLWRAHGGGQHGPNVETVTMPLCRFRDFMDAAEVFYDTAARASLSHTMGVKGLEWEWGNRCGMSTTPLGSYYIEEFQHRGFLVTYNETPLHDHPTLEAAKAAAQSDYEQRIRSALTPTAMTEAYSVKGLQHPEYAHGISEAELIKEAIAFAPRKHTMSGVTTKLRKLLQAMPNTGRGIIWQRSNGLDGERLEVFGSVATALKYILDNADDVVAALAPSEAVRCDAERYRYLRNVAEGKIGERHLNPPSISDWARNFDPRATYNIWTSYSLKGDDLDREIDAALKSINGEVKK